MKKLYLILTLSATLVTSNAQEKLSEITAPTSPAAYLLGAQPSAVLSPKSFQALEAALFSNFSNGEGKGILPNDFALEFTPYWAADHGLTLEDYLFPKNPLDQWWRNSSFSVASSQNFLFEDKTTSNGLSFGYRTSFFIGGGNDRTKIEDFTTKLKQNQKFKTRIKTDIQSVNHKIEVDDKASFLGEILPKITFRIKEAYGITPKQKDIDSLSAALQAGMNGLPNYKADDSAFSDAFSDLLNPLTDRIFRPDVVFENFKEYIEHRNGFSLDLAYGAFLNFPGNKFDYSVMPRQSLWITPTYNFKGSADFLKLMLVARYEWYDIDYYTKYFPSATNFKHNWDVGLAVSGEFKKLSVQLEAVNRSRKTRIKEGLNPQGVQLFSEKSDDDFQCIGTFSYRINKQIALSYSLGDGFEQLTNQGKTLISLLSLNLGFGGPTKNDLTTK